LGRLRPHRKLLHLNERELRFLAESALGCADKDSWQWVMSQQQPGLSTVDLLTSLESGLQSSAASPNEAVRMATLELIGQVEPGHWSRLTPEQRANLFQTCWQIATETTNQNVRQSARQALLALDELEYSARLQRRMTAAGYIKGLGRLQIAQIGPALYRVHPASIRAWDSDSVQEIVRTLVELGQPTIALPLARDVVKITPRPAAAADTLAHAAYAAKRWSEAFEAWTNAPTLDPRRMKPADHEKLEDARRRAAQEKK